MFIQTLPTPNLATLKFLARPRRVAGDGLRIYLAGRGECSRWLTALFALNGVGNVFLGATSSRSPSRTKPTGPC